jgi:hypothetical protein
MRRRCANMRTHCLDSRSAWTALDADCASRLHEIGSADILALVLSVLAQKEVAEVSHRIIYLTRDLLVEEKKRAIRSSTRREVGSILGRISGCWKFNLWCYICWNYGAFTYLSRGTQI